MILPCVNNSRIMKLPCVNILVMNNSSRIMKLPCVNNSRIMNYVP